VLNLFSTLFGSKVARPWFESDGLEAYLARARLDPETETFIRDLARDGFAAVDLGDAARALCDQAITETEGFFEPGITRVQDAWYQSQAVRRLAVWPQMRRLLKAAYGRDPFPFQTLNFRQGSQQSIHSDTIHFHSQPERFMCGVWIALEDVREGAGPLVYHPGSHRMPVMTMRGAGVNEQRPTAEHYEQVYVPRYAEAVAESGLPQSRALLPKGWAFVWAANLAHGGSLIAEAGATRRSLVVHNFFEDCVYYTPLHSSEPGGYLHVRLPPNIRTGWIYWPRRNGRPVRLSRELVHEALNRDLARKPLPM
jgi:ectoine hydroxylase-related dioxygenase (phytanoyl-CoA dioxygenase family)